MVDAPGRPVPPVVSSPNVANMGYDRGGDMWDNISTRCAP